MVKHIGNYHRENIEGLRKAYAAPDKCHINHNKLYLAGTTGPYEPANFISDWMHNFGSIPVWGDTRNITRYKTADKVLKDNPNINEIVGHSQSGSVALQLQKDYPNKFKTVTYNAPVVDFSRNKNAERYRIPSTKIPGLPGLSKFTGDPVSFFDWSAKPVETSFLNKINPLSAHGLSAFISD